MAPERGAGRQPPLIFPSFTPNNSLNAAPELAAAHQGCANERGINSGLAAAGEVFVRLNAAGCEIQASPGNLPQSPMTAESAAARSTCNFCRSRALTWVFWRRFAPAISTSLASNTSATASMPKDSGAFSRKSRKTAASGVWRTIKQQGGKPGNLRPWPAPGSIKNEVFAQNGQAG